MTKVSTNRREFTVEPFHCGDCFSDWTICEGHREETHVYPPNKPEDILHLVTIKPGEVILSRDELIQAFNRVLGVTDAGGWGTGKLICDELFGGGEG